MSDSTFIVVGSGVFGASTALTLVQAGHRVIVLDRSADGYAAPDAASNDLNKIVRADYSDAHYRDLGKTAISMWRRSELLRPYYHETGVFFHTGPSAASSGDDAAAALARADNQTYVRNAVASAAVSTDREQPYPGQPLKPLAHAVSSREQVDACFPAAMRSHLGRLADDVTQGKSTAYFNPRGGWAEANLATRAVLDEAKRLGAQVVAHAHVQRLLFADGDGSKDEEVTGVQCADGRRFHISGKGQVAVCAGGWAEGLLRDWSGDGSQPHQQITPTWPSAQCVLTVQLSEGQRKMFAGTPVVLEFASGFYLFEPDANGLMKVAIHSSGYGSPQPSRSVSAPTGFPTFGSADSVDNGGQQPQQQDTDAARDSTMKKGSIPADQTEHMLERLRYAFPALADAPVVFKRICFYSESLDENWIIDSVPGFRNLVMASGDSGHAFKFLPLLGTLVCARMGIVQAGSLTAHQQRVFSFAHHDDMHRQSTQSQRESSNFKARL